MCCTTTFSPLFVDFILDKKVNNVQMTASMNVFDALRLEDRRLIPDMRHRPEMPNLRC